jgi:hypothetical protein
MVTEDAQRDHRHNVIAAAERMGEAASQAVTDTARVRSRRRCDEYRDPGERQHSSRIVSSSRRYVHGQACDDVRRRAYADSAAETA